MQQNSLGFILAQVVLTLAWASGRVLISNPEIGMFVRANFVDIYSQRMRDRSMRSGTELAREIKLTDWSMAGNLSNRSSGVQIPCDICTRLKRYLYSAKCSWIIKDLSNDAQIRVIGRMEPEICTKMLKKLSEKLSKIFCHYTWLLHGKSCPSWWRFLRSFLTASKPSWRLITAAKRKEKEKKERREKKFKNRKA